jgi:HSP20 family protein
MEIESPGETKYSIIMTLIKWQKEAPSRTLFPSTADLINDFFNDFTAPDFRRWQAPAVNVSENEQSYKLHLAAPGLKKENFKITVEEGNQLLITGEQQKEKEESGEKFTRKEFSFSSFSRRFNLPENVDAQHIQANYENGILLVHLPKTVQEKQKTREINIG